MTVTYTPLYTCFYLLLRIEKGMNIPANKAAMVAANPPVIDPPWRVKTSQKTPASMPNVKMRPRLSLCHIEYKPRNITTP